MNRTPDFDQGLLPSDHEFERMKGNVLERLDRTESAPHAVSPLRPTRRRPSRRRTLGVAAAVVVLALLGTTFVMATVSQGEARQAVFAQIESRMGAVDAVWVEKTLAELLPNALFSVNGREPAPLAAGIVVGRVTAVSEGRGYVLVGDDADSDTEVPFDTKDPLYRTINVTVEIAQGWGEVTGEPTVSFAAFVEGRENPRTAMDNWSQLGEIIVVLNPPGSYDYDPTLYRVRQGGSLIGPVSGDGTISFPAMAEREQGFLGGIRTLSDLEKAAAEDAKTIAVSSDDNYARQ